jgi:hypothetical protein
LKQGLAEAASHGHAVLLSTQEEKNVTFYSRMGFEVIHTDFYLTDDGTPPIPNWFMIKMPTTAAQ